MNLYQNKLSIYPVNGNEYLIRYVPECYKKMSLIELEVVQKTYTFINSSNQGCNLIFI